MCQEKITEAEKVSQIYLATILEYMSYLNQKAVAEKAQSDLDEQIRKTKK